MKKLLTTLTIGLLATSGVSAIVIAAAGTAHASSTTTTTLAPPFGGVNKHPLFVDVNTVEGAGGVPKPAAGCAMTNLFVRGQLVVFRMWGVDVMTGGQTLTNKNVLRAYVTVPGKAKILLVYGTHGTISYWTAPFSTAGYPLGVVNFTVTVISKPVPKTATHARIPEQKVVFSQAGLPSVSVLTVT